MKLPKITIVTPSYNQASYLEETIDSVVSQNYKNLEYMIFDGGSADESVGIIKKYEKYLTYWESVPDEGQTDAINKGLKRATGDVFNWLNSDDYYEKDALQKVGEAFLDKELDVFCGTSRIFDQNGTKQISSGTDLYEDLPKTIGLARIDQPETFFRLEKIVSVGLLNTHLNYVMDKELWIRYLLRYGLSRIKKSSEILVNFRHHERSKTISSAKGFEEETNALYLKICNDNQLYEKSLVLANLLPHKQLVSERWVTSFAEAIINYFLLYQTDLAYYRGNTTLSRRLLNEIQPELLPFSADQKLFEKLVFRTRFVPKWLLSLKRRASRLREKYNR